MQSFDARIRRRPGVYYFPSSEHRSNQPQLNCRATSYTASQEFSEFTLQQSLETGVRSTLQHTKSKAIAQTRCTADLDPPIH